MYNADAPVSSTRMRVAAATALGAAAVKAKLLADAEERELQKQVQIAVEAQMQKVQLKLNSMKQLDEALEKERSTMEVRLTIYVCCASAMMLGKLMHSCVLLSFQWYNSQAKTLPSKLTPAAKSSWCGQRLDMCINLTCLLLV